LRGLKLRSQVGVSLFHRGVAERFPCYCFISLCCYLSLRLKHFGRDSERLKLWRNGSGIQKKKILYPFGWGKRILDDGFHDDELYFLLLQWSWRC